MKRKNNLAGKECTQPRTQPAEIDHNRMNKLLLGKVICNNRKCDSCPYETSDCVKLIIAPGYHVCADFTI